MSRLQQWGSRGAYVAAATFVIGLVMFATMLIDFTTATDPTEAVAFLVDNHAPLFVWNLIITIVFGVALVPLVLALRDRLADESPALARTGSVFGLIWVGLIVATGMIVNVGYGTVIDLHETDRAMAATVWSAVDSVANGLGGGNEIVGGVWVMLVSLAALRAGVFSRKLHYLGIVAGVTGLMTVVPGLEPVGAVFGLGMIAWFAAIGVALARNRTTPTTQPFAAAPAAGRRS